MSFSRVNSGGWTDDLSTVTAAQLNSLDINVSRAVDGNAGGSYTPSSRIVIGNAGFGVDGAEKLARTNSGSIIRVQDLFYATKYNTAAGWRPAANTEWQNDGTGAEILNIQIHIPHGATLTAIDVYFQGSSSLGVLPAAGNMPKLELFRVDLTGVSTSLAGPTADTTSPLASFKNVHAITMSGLNVAITRTLYRYFVQVTANADAGGDKIWALRTTYTPDRIDED